MAQLQPLPRSVQEIADCIGREKALELVGKLPRLRPPSCTKNEQRVCLYVPEQLTDNHRLIELIGKPAAQKLVDRFPGEILHLATCRGLINAHRDRAVVRMRRDGWSLATISWSFGLSQRQITNILRTHNGGKVRS